MALNGAEAVRLFAPDDYLTKPFAVAELVVRVEALAAVTPRPGEVVRRRMVACASLPGW